MILDRDKFDTKEDFLFHIYNNLGCSDLKLCCSYIINGELCFSKWIKYHDLMHYDFDEYLPNTKYTRKRFMKECSHRTVLDIELMLDIDEPGEFPTIKDKAIDVCQKLTNSKVNFTCYFTGSKSYHISIIMPELRDWPKRLKLKAFKLITIKFCGDIQVAMQNHMIAMEGEPHYKSGKIKSKVNLIG